MKYFPLIYCIFCLWSSTFGQSDIELGFFQYSPIELEEGQKCKAEFSLKGIWPSKYENDVFVCKIMKSSKLAPILVTPLSFEIHKSSPKQIIVITVKEDNDCRDDRPYVGVEVRCTKNSEELTISKYNGVYFSVIDNTVGEICNKHRIQQFVKGYNENGEEVHEKICYDIYGEHGDVFEFVTDSLLGVSAYFEIREEYHVGRIFIITRQGSIEINRDFITGPENFHQTWGQVKRIEVGTDFKLVIDLNKKLLIKVEDEGRVLALVIIKEEKSFEKSHLNIAVEETTPNQKILDEFQGGLLGSAANNVYHFNKSVQRGRESVTKVKINQRPVASKLQLINDNEECHLINIEDIIFPMPVSLFLRSD
ncbi:DgyrCDS9727 [Dimorphilus gyrociliatus]|uniref:DgyrCDS9727 n=1 Tax=Dimorphilus gyrociliatus TaxID=2664684 RepID=A0A7I8VZ39_9ANNE|nr:DgyrCDS9727 [Dimorphilus gyrociliatus]